MRVSACSVAGVQNALPLRLHHLLRRISSFPSTADTGQIHPAVVWRNASGLDHLHAFLSVTAVGRLFVRPLPVQ